ncbi:MAG TPA: hypothetical protein VF599_04730 [Pyrinomonadaceae bacterium]|jgi:hypothetical protein
MKSVGKLVQEAIDFMNAGSYEAAFVPTCTAINETAKKIFETENYQRFIRENWQLVSFMGLPRALPLPLNIPFALKRIVPAFNSHHGAKEIIFHLVQQTLSTGKMPAQFAFASTDIFEIKKNKLLIPLSLLGGLLGVVIVQSVNKGELIDEKYWMNIADFKMFISELWGRSDLAERIMKFYLE